MTLRTFLIASAAVLTLGTASLPAYAGGSTMHVEQYGFDNAFGGGQHGHRNRITLYQNGYGNSSINNQTGARNKAVVGQEGYGNSADTLQLGRRNIVGIAQFGTGHNRRHHPRRQRQRHRRDPGRP